LTTTSQYQHLAIAIDQHLAIAIALKGKEEKQQNSSS